MTQTMPAIESQGCWLCGSQASVRIAQRAHDPNAAVFRRVQDHFGVLRCAGCGLVRLDPLPSEEQLKEFYAAEYRQLSTQRGVQEAGRPAPAFLETQARHAARRAGFIRELVQRGFLARGSALDVGCGTGELLSVLARDGWDVLGIEPHRAFSDYARQTHRIEVRTATLQEADLGGMTFDLITLYHVLHHLGRPLELLEMLSRRLSERGVLLLEVPNFNQYRARLIDAWRAIRGLAGSAYFFQTPHLYYFTPNTLRATLRQGGFRPLVERSVTTRLGLVDRMAERCQAADWLVVAAQRAPH